MDRITGITHPDGTYEQFVYNLLDLAATRDRLGRWTTNTYNADRQLIQTQDPLGRVTGYEWCQCGALTGLIDPMGRETTWDYDLQSRPIAKHYVDGSIISYFYENTTSRLYSKMDEQGQETICQYNVDDTLASVSYPNAIVPTPTVAYTYDPDYNRILTMQDGTGTTLYTYNPITPTPVLGAGRLASVSVPLPSSSVTYQYDSLGRVASRAINGVAQAFTFDVLGRPATVTNTLGAFQYTYVGATSRLASESYPNGQTNLYSYYNNLGDQRLRQIQHLYPNGSLLSGFGYAYNAVGQITAWTNQWDTLPTRVWLPSYDAADQLTSVGSIGGPTPATNYTYAYDPAGNRTLAQSNVVQNQFTYNALNQLVGANPGLTNSATYEWDGENRLTAINQGANRSEFTYDGLSRRVGITEKTNGVVMTNNTYLWCGNQICEVRDATGTNVLRRIFAQGEVVFRGTGSMNYFCARDHLGSIRDACNSEGALATRYDYDPYGQSWTTQQDFQATFSYTGQFLHAPSGLYLSKYRAESGSTGRWLSRDPLGDIAGFDYYTYAGNNPLNYYDNLGLAPNFWYIGKSLFAIGGPRPDIPIGSFGNLVAGNLPIGILVQSSSWVTLLGSAYTVYKAGNSGWSVAQDINNDKAFDAFSKLVFFVAGFNPVGAAVNTGWSIGTLGGDTINYLWAWRSGQLIGESLYDRLNPNDDDGLNGNDYNYMFPNSDYIGPNNWNRFNFKSGGCHLSIQ